jgi:hypothetical protein
MMTDEGDEKKNQSNKMKHVFNSTEKRQLTLMAEKVEE